MNTPIYDFVRRYAASGVSRLHMPGHKGQGLLGCETLDITEVSGADALYEAEGVIAQSERNAAQLFGTQCTLYSTEGSSQCIRAMLHLCIMLRKKGMSNTIVAARNVHKAFVYAAALIGFDIVWLWPERMDSLCACPITPEALKKTLQSLSAPPAAVYVTSPDYLGNLQDIKALSDICHQYSTILAVDNAHGAYLRFLTPSLHPMDLGADICCDSAHKTLGVLTGGAYLHISNRLSSAFAQQAKAAMAVYGSTSPSYLTLCSLDKCNAQLAGSYRQELQKTTERIDRFCAELHANGWSFSHKEPLKVTLHASKCGLHGDALKKRLQEHRIECEYADPDDVVLMFSPSNTSQDFERLSAALRFPPQDACTRPALPLPVCPQITSVRTAIFSKQKIIPAAQSAGYICASPTVGCPPAIPIIVSGERITKEACALLAYYGIEHVAVVMDDQA